MARSVTFFLPPPVRTRGLPAAGWLGRGLLIAAIGLLALLAVSQPASAHGDDETQEGYLLVQQALGYLADDTSHEGVDLAMEKVDDALAAEDHDGVAVAEVENAMSALKAGDVGLGRVLLQDSIKEALDNLPPAIGNETGTKVVLPELPGRPDLRGQDWGFLVGSVALLLLGVGLAFRFRPRDSVGELRRRLGASGTGPDGGPPESLNVGRHP